MKRKINIIGLTLFFTLTLFSLAFSEESITITTYYPSPYGSYNELRTYSNTYLATDSGNVGIGTTGPTARLEVEDYNNPSGVPARIDRNYDGTRLQFQYAGSTVDIGEIGMVDNTGAGAMQLWTGANLNSVGGHTGPLQNNSSASSWYSSWNTSSDNYAIVRIPAGGSASTAFLINSSGNVGIGTTSPGAKLEVSGDFIRTISRVAGYSADGTDSGQIVSRVLSISKKQAATGIRVTYVDNLRTVACNSCRWEIRFDGNSCTNPGGLYYDVYACATGENSHQTRTLIGTCFGPAAGAHQVQIWVSSTPGYSGADCYTGWSNQYWTIEAEEVR